MSTQTDRSGRIEPGTTRRRVVAALFLVACLATTAQCSKSQAAPEAKATTTASSAESTTSSTTGRGPLAPLTGLPTKAAVAKRCAVSVKVGNTAEARPQYGIGAADVVYEIVVDGGITRLMAVFQSRAPGKVGGLRSVRPTDHTLVQPLRGVFAFSGGNQIELDSIRGAPVRLLDEVRAGAMMMRDPNGHAPNNLYARVDQMYKACPNGAPQPLFTFRKPGAKATGSPVQSMTVHYQSPYDVTWTWDAKARKWLRTRLGGPDVLADGKRVGVANVVAMSISYSPSPDAPDAAGIVEGSGPVSVFSAGRVTKGTWSRTDRSKPAKLLDAEGRQIALTPGKTWVELPDRSYAVTTEP